MDIREHAGISMQVHGYPQTSMDIHGHPQMSLDIHGDLWKSIMDIIGYPLIFTDIPRYPWIAMEIIGRQRISMAIVLGSAHFVESVFENKKPPHMFGGTETRNEHFQ